MSVKVKRNARGTLSAVLNLVLVAAAGVVTIGNELVKPAASTIWLVIGLLLLGWSAVILSGLLRPLVAESDADGITIRKLIGINRFAWSELAWIDFDHSARFALVGAVIDGREQFGILGRRGADAQSLAALEAEIKSRRPDIPTSRPKPA